MVLHRKVLEHLEPTRGRGAIKKAPLIVGIFFPQATAFIESVNYLYHFYDLMFESHEHMVDNELEQSAFKEQSGLYLESRNVSVH